MFTETRTKLPVLSAKEAQKKLTIFDALFAVEQVMLTYQTKKENEMKEICNYKDCNGRGKYTESIKCNQCNGGVVIQTDRFGNSYTVACQDCDRGWINKLIECPRCRGTGYIER